MLTRWLIQSVPSVGSIRPERLNRYESKYDRRMVITPWLHRWKSSVTLSIAAFILLRPLQPRSVASMTVNVTYRSLTANFSAHSYNIFSLRIKLCLDQAVSQWLDDWPVGLFWRLTGRSPTVLESER